MEKRIEIQKYLFHNFIDFKKVFDRVWHQSLWRVMDTFCIFNGITQFIKSLYKSSTIAILLDNVTGDYCKSTVGVQQGGILSPDICNMYLEQIMSDILKYHHSNISIGSRNI